MGKERDSGLRLVTGDNDPTELSRDYPDRFLDCRAIGHRWRVIGYFHANGEVNRSLMCERCKSDRRDRWSPGGTRLGSSYDHAEGYLIHGGEAVRAYDVRKEVLSRVTIYDSAEAMAEAMFKGRRTS
jgi:hypothetical protein